MSSLSHRRHPKRSGAQRPGFIADGELQDAGDERASLILLRGDRGRLDLPARHEAACIANSPDLERATLIGRLWRRQVDTASRRIPASVEPNQGGLLVGTATAERFEFYPVSAVSIRNDVASERVFIIGIRPTATSSNQCQEQDHSHPIRLRRLSADCNAARVFSGESLT